MANDKTDFKVNRIKKLKTLYSDAPSEKRRFDEQPGYAIKEFPNAAAVRKALTDALNNTDSIETASKKLYAINPIYAGVINYLANMYSWKYKVTPHRIYTKSKAKMRKKPKEDDFRNMYSLMLETVDGLSIETKFPSLLTLLYICGSVYFTTVCDTDSITIDTILLPNKYCRKIGETQFGTAIIEFDCSYFRDLGLKENDLKDYLKSFPAEFKSLYNKYLKDPSQRWSVLDPHYSSGILLNEVGIPTWFYLYGSILDYEKYQDNELERSNNLLKYIVVHTMPHYEDKLIFEVDEVEAMHKSLRRIVETGDKARLITTYGDVHVDRIGDTDTSENEILSKAFKTIFNSGNLNDALFAAESVEALKVSIKRDKNYVWHHIQQILNFYNIAINNWFDFRDYQADIDILPISPYTYDDDMETYRENATLGVGKLDYFIASGVKQKNIEDQLYLESFLKLDKITPMQTSYTQTAEDREEGDNTNSSDSNRIAVDDNETSSNTTTTTNVNTDDENEPSTSDN